MCAFGIRKELLWRSERRAIARFCCVALLLAGTGLRAAWADDAKPPYDSTADTVFDIIRADDPTSFRCLTYAGQAPRQIWDKRVDGEPVVDAFLFNADYADGSTVEMAVNPEFASADRARAEAMRYAVPLGQLPALLRAGVKRFSIHGGDKAFHAGTGQIVVYADKARQRIEQNHLEESIFHEAVHASLDDKHREAPAWKQAQIADGRFLTSYGQSRPDREDLAETALFAFAILRFPDRFPPIDSDTVRDAVPHRFAYIEQLFSKADPPVADATATVPCQRDGS